jgi:hypothetical protein
MALQRVTFEVETGELFDRLHDMKGDCGPLGERLAGALMTGEMSFGDAIGLGIYGVTLVEVCPVTK